MLGVHRTQWFSAAAATTAAAAIADDVICKRVSGWWLAVGGWWSTGFKARNGKTGLERVADGVRSKAGRRGIG